MNLEQRLSDILANHTPHDILHILDVDEIKNYASDTLGMLRTDNYQLPKESECLDYLEDLRKLSSEHGYFTFLDKFEKFKESF